MASHGIHLKRGLDIFGIQTLGNLNGRTDEDHLLHGIATKRVGLSCNKVVVKQVQCLKITASSFSNSPQNVDLPPILPKRKKKPYLTPLKTQHQRKRRPLPEGVEIPVRPPANGLLVEKLIPVAHSVIQAKGVLEKGVSRLVDTFPVKTCRFCTEVHVGPVGHNLGTCRGPKSNLRMSQHDWLKGTVDDIFVPIEAYHLEDRLGAPISHEMRFDVERVSAVEELCYQAGVDNPRYPTKRYMEPVVPRVRKKVEDASWVPGDQYFDPEYIIKETNTKKAAHPLDDTGWTEESLVEGNRQLDDRIDKVVEYKIGENEDVTDASRVEGRVEEDEAEEEISVIPEISDDDDIKTVAEKTLLAWEAVRHGCKRLMRKYRVVACGYCPEVHVGPRGHRARNCGAFKHQWRDGKHGWQDAALDELIPSQYVWHLRDREGPPLESALKRFYGKAPALVELCVHAGVAVPDKYKPLMRLDIAIPTMEEVELVV